MDSDETNAPSPTAVPASRRSGLLPVVAVALIVIGAAAYCWQLRPPPYRLSVDPGLLTLSADDSPADKGSKRRVTVDLINTGRSAIEVSSVHTLCDCTVAGPVPKEPLAPGERSTLRLEVDLPYYGTQRTEVRILTNPHSTQPATLVLEMHGRTVRTPYVSEVPRPAQLIARRPGKVIEHSFEIETVEAIGSDPWLTGMRSDLPEASVELLGVRTTRENSAAETVARLYEFLLRVPAPAHERGVLAFSLTEQGTRSSVGRVQQYPIRVSYVPQVRVVPQEILLEIDSDTQFPLTRTLELVPNDEQPHLTIAEISAKSELITAEQVADTTGPEASSEGTVPLRIAVQVRDWPDRSGSSDSESELLLSFIDADTPPVRVPVTVVDRRSLVIP